jgi:hypothetical protein
MSIEHWEETKCGKFLISTHGRLYSRKRSVPTKDITGKWTTRQVGGYFVKMNIANTGYRRVNMSGEIRLLHHVIAEIFLPEPGPGASTINHKNLNKLDNRVENLEWTTASENAKHAWENGACDSQYCAVRCVGTGKEYPSLHAAADSIGLAVGNLCSHLKGRQKTFGGHIWEYKKLQREVG